MRYHKPVSNLYTVADIAKRWNVDESTVRRYIRDGHPTGVSLVAMRLGRRLNVSQSALDRFELALQRLQKPGRLGDENHAYQGESHESGVQPDVQDSNKVEEVQ